MYRMKQISIKSVPPGTFYQLSIIN